MTEFQTIINNGLPVLVRGTVHQVPPARISGQELHRRPGSALVERKAVQSGPHAGR